MKLFRTPHSGPVLPTVNLLSPWSFEAMSTRRLRQRFSFGCLLLVLVIAAGWGAQYLRVNQAQTLLKTEQAHVGLLTAETKELAPVQTFVASVEQQKATVQDTMAREIYFSLVLKALDGAASADVDVASAIVALNPVTPPAAATEEEAAGAAPAALPPSLCPGPDPFNTRVVVGCVTLSGSATNRAAVGDLVIRLGDSDLFVEPFISATTTAEGEVTFTGSVGLSERVFSNRYAELDALLPEGGAQ